MEGLLISDGSKYECINKFAFFLNIPASNLVDSLKKTSVVDKSINHYFSRWRQWSKEQAIRLEKHCGSLMTKYRYG